MFNRTNTVYDLHLRAFWFDNPTS